MNQSLSKLLLTAVLVITSPLLSLAEEAAQIVSVTGACEVMKNGEDKFSPLTKSSSVQVGDSIKTGSTGRVALKLIGGGIIRLNPNSNFVLSKTGEENSATLSAGKAFFFSRESQRFPTIQTPAVTAAVRGTEFAVEITGEQTRVAVIDGQVYAANKVGAVTLGANEVAAASKGKAPQKYLLLNPLDAVQWAIYVPDLSELDGATANKNEVNTINGLNQLIKAGRLDEAQQHASSLIKNSSSKNVKAWAHANKAVIALALNQKDKAKEEANLALSSKSDSQVALYAMSLVDQAFFNLDGAKQNTETILALNPKNAAAAVRLAELQLSMGETDKAEKTLEALPASARRDTLLGFVKLIRYHSSEAQNLFRSSLNIDANSALARLGLGLSQINSGNLAEGRGELEIAAALEPNVAIYRSYLGKAYFEENRSHMASHEYNRAINLDPNDPTPYLYRAFERLSKNNPVGALEDIEDSIARNNNRAVYRSSLLLDRDSGVRSASLAEVFTSLGFNRAAQIEAIKSINKNYGNFSAHKLLSESYNTINTVDALVSEQIIARAYAPLTLNLLGGPQSSASVNDYNAFFDRSEIRQRVGFIGKSAEDILAPYAALAGRSDESAYRLIAESAFGNGSKEDDYLRDYRFIGTLQHQLTPDLRVFTEAKYQARHVVDKYAILDDVQFETQDYTLGFNQDLSVQTKLVGQVTYRDSRQRQYSIQERLSYLEIILDRETYSFEDNLLLREFAKADFRDTRISAQLLHETDKISVIAGAEQYFGNPNRLESSIILGDDLAIFDGLERELVSEGDTSLHSSDFYLYPTIHATDYLDINTGVTYTDLELEASDTAPFANETESRSKWSPKLGATLYASSDLTLRAAYFEGLRKSALEDSGTLEPTLVGGFNQIYTDFTGAETQSYGFGADYKASKSTYLGLETTIRDVNIDFDTVDSFLVVDFDSGRIDSLSAVTGVGALDYDQQYASAYVYQILSPHWVTTLDYNFFRSEIKDPQIDQDISLHKTKGSLRYFDPSGWFAFSDLTYRDQNRINSFFEEAGSSQFWLVDLGVGYRFSNRQGSITLKGNNIFDKDFTYDQSLGFEEFLIDSMYGEIAVNFNF